MARRRRIIRNQGFESFSGYPGWYGISVDEDGNRAGPIDWRALITAPFQFVWLFVFALIVLLVPLFWFIEEMLGVPHNG